MKRISVIMGIYNCENMLKESVDSIINQTYENWELIMCDDCSSDNTYKIAKSYVDKYPNKIKLIRNKENLKLAATLNNCLKHANGYYIARMDADDISLPARFEKQVEFLEKNKEYDLVSTSMISFNGNKELGIRGILPEIPDPAKLALNTPFCHATIMTKKNVYEKLNGYRVSSETVRCEDIDLWFRFFEAGFKGINLKEPLYKVRDDEASYKRRKLKDSIVVAKLCFNGYKKIGVPKSSYKYILKPLISGFTPIFLKKIYHKKTAS